MEKVKQLIKKVNGWGLFLFISVAIFYVSQNMLAGVLERINWKLQLVNIIFFLLFMLFSSSIFSKASIGMRFTLAITWLVSLVNAYIFEFRGSYIMPWDIFSVGTALNVANNFSYVPTVRMIVTTILFIGLFILAGFCKLDFSKLFGHKYKRFILTAVSLAVTVCLAISLQKESVVEKLGIYTIQFDTDGLVRKNGLTVAFAHELKYLTVEKVPGYSAAKQKEILDNTEPAAVSGNQTPDIIVIMDEAFSDPAVDGEISTNVDYMPFVHSLLAGAENTQSGHLNMSVIGGNTPNSEFEFLTGNSMAFLPRGSIAYQQFIRHKIDSMPSYLKSLGYSTIAMHPYDSSGWNRTTVYPLLNFDEMYFEDGYFENMNLAEVRKYVSDDAFFDQIIKEVDQRAEKGPVFSFNVTMQNHSSYGETYDNLPWTVSINGIEEMDRQGQRMTNYINLISLTDKALEEFIDHYRNSDRPTLIVFFGDHQPDPSVYNVLWNQNGKNSEELSTEDTFNTYRVPFIVWANYDIEEMSGLEISDNYLGNLALKAAGIPLTRYRTFTDEFSKKYPVISAIRTVDAEGNSYATDDVMSQLDEYSAMQYYEMFDDYDDYE